MNKLKDKLPIPRTVGLTMPKNLRGQCIDEELYNYIMAFGAHMYKKGKNERKGK